MGQWAANGPGGLPGRSYDATPSSLGLGLLRNDIFYVFTSLMVIWTVPIIHSTYINQ